MGWLSTIKSFYLATHQTLPDAPCRIGGRLTWAGRRSMAPPGWRVAGQPLRAPPWPPPLTVWLVALAATLFFVPGGPCWLSAEEIPRFASPGANSESEWVLLYRIESLPQGGLEGCVCMWSPPSSAMRHLCLSRPDIRRVCSGRRLDSSSVQLNSTNSFRHQLTLA
jgi:hypothetical protein